MPTLSKVSSNSPQRRHSAKDAIATTKRVPLNAINHIKTTFKQSVKVLNSNSFVPKFLKPRFPLRHTSVANIPGPAQDTAHASQPKLVSQVSPRVPEECDFDAWCFVERAAHRSRRLLGDLADTPFDSDGTRKRKLLDLAIVFEDILSAPAEEGAPPREEATAPIERVAEVCHYCVPIAHC